MSKLHIKAVRSYSHDRTVELDLSKSINIIYGQNGAGKSTISGYFYKPHDIAYQNCHFDSNHEYRYMVYNSQFVEDSFYNNSEQPGIFTLSSNNKIVMGEIDEITKKVVELKKLKKELLSKLEQKNISLVGIKSKCKEAIWSKTVTIRRKDQGLGDLMTGCLQKTSFFERVTSQSEMEEIDIKKLTSEYQALREHQNVTYQLFKVPPTPVLTEKQKKLLSIPIISSENSYLSTLIERLGNSDWVRSGLSYLHGDCCPFCQRKTIDDNYRNEISKIFDDTYNKTLSTIGELKLLYSESVEMFIGGIRNEIIQSDYIADKSDVINQISDVEIFFHSNIDLIQKKIEKPSSSIMLNEHSSGLDSLLRMILNYNVNIRSINEKVGRYEQSISELKRNLWSAIRFICNEVIVIYEEQKKDVVIDISKINIEIDSVQQQIDESNDRLDLLTSQVSNVDETINKINNTLESLGLVSFKIVKSERGGFQISRGEQGGNYVYKTLSEGEKTLISFLYFIELCCGRVDNDQEGQKDKLIVVDDPISSLSHDYIYEISSLLHHRLIKKPDSNKVLILTHNLFFFQELIKLAPSKKKDFTKKYQLYRVVKNEFSDVLLIDRDDVKNEYEALWLILKDVRDGKLNPVVLPNVMRNILEYYFSFSCKMETLSEELDKLVSSETDLNYKTFYRYINRGSHSDAININNLGQITGVKYIEMFEEIFKKTNDERHFNKMLGVEIEEVA